MKANASATYQLPKNVAPNLRVPLQAMPGSNRLRLAGHTQRICKPRFDTSNGENPNLRSTPEVEPQAESRLRGTKSPEACDQRDEFPTSFRDAEIVELHATHAPQQSQDTCCCNAQLKLPGHRRRRQFHGVLSTTQKDRWKEHTECRFWKQVPA